MKLPTKFIELCIAVKILKGFTFSTKPSQSFCGKNKIPYNIFQKWFKDTRKKVVEVQIDSAPMIYHEEKTKTSEQTKPISKKQ